MSDANKRMGVRATFEVYEDGGGKWRWRMVHRNGNIIADSAEGYSSRLAAVDGLDAVRALAPTARLDVEGRDGEPIPDGGGVINGDKPDDYTPPRQREHYWVECRHCGEETYDLERRCIHCGSDRQAHREPEHRDPDRHRMPDGGVTVERDEPNLPEAIERVLDDAAGGVDRQVLVERVAELSGATTDAVEDALDAEIRHGRVIDTDGEVRRENNRRFAGRAR